VNALMEAEGLRRGIHHVYDRPKRNKALPDHNGIGSAVLDGHESCPPRPLAMSRYAWRWTTSHCALGQMKSPLPSACWSV
jgi:hypothetical protein